MTNPLKAGDPGTSTLNANTIDKIVAKYGVPPPGSNAEFVAAAKPRPTFQEEAAPFTGGINDPLTNAVHALAAGRNGVDAWTLKTRALELDGFLPGDVVLVDLNAAPHHGDVVCAQVYDFGSMKAETVMRVFENAGPIKILVSRTMDRSLQQSLVVDDDRVIVKGVLLPHRLRAA